MRMKRLGRGIDGGKGVEGIGRVDESEGVSQYLSYAHQLLPLHAAF